MPRRPAHLLTALAALLVGVGGVTVARVSDAAEQQPAAVTMATVAYPAPAGDVPNPDRGPMRFYECGGSDLSATTLTQRRRDEGTTLAWCMFYLRDYRTRDLDATVLDRLGRQFATIRSAGVKTILRFAYTDDMVGDDATPAQVLRHIGQLAPVLRANADVIATVQAGFIGAWGEWYYTQHFGNEGRVSATDQANRKAVVDALLAALPSDRMVQVRYPGLKRAMQGAGTLPESRAYDGSAAARIGFHNDCFLADAQDMGTFPEAADRTYLAAETRFVVMGGETCGVNAPRSQCPTALAELAQFHWSHLNLDYHPDVLASWRSGGCFTTITRNLGYRFALTDGTFPATAAPGGELAIRFGVRNEGYAAPYNPRGAQLVLRHANGQVTRLPLAADPRRWAAGTTTTVAQTLRLPAGLAAGQYQLGLALPDPAASLKDRPEYAAAVANAGLWRAADGWNDLRHTVTITPSGATTPAGPTPTRTTASPTVRPPATPTPPPTTSTPGVAAWAPYVAYRVGDRVTHVGSTYRALQAHTSLPGWEPSIVPALWSPVG
jgi:hypothetical protein